LEQRQSRTRVKIIENTRERAIAVADELRRTVVLQGSALDQKLLLEADIQDADLMVALTNNDQVNILASAMAKRLGCKGNLAVINNPAFHDIAGTLGIDAYVNPRAITISRVLQHVRRGRIRAVHSVHKGLAEVIEAEALETSPLVGSALRDVELPDGVRVGAVFRDGVVLKPNGSLKIKAKDRVIIFAMASAVKQVEQMFRVSLEFF
jgi:trk system potassium uptake protein TrkA